MAAVKGEKAEWSPDMSHGNTALEALAHPLVLL